MPRLLVCLPLVACVSIISMAQTSSPPTPARTAPQKVERATWVEGTIAAFGLSQDDFRAMGLFKLTPSEYGEVLRWDLRRTAQAVADTKSELPPPPPHQTYTCGRSAADEASTTKVNLLVAYSSQTPSELSSGVNQGLRGISDVAIVYDKSDADLSVSILGYLNALENSNRTIGYIASTNTTTPCVGQFGTNKWNFEMESNHILNSGPDVKSVVDKIVTSLDSLDIEASRQEHAMFKKYLNQQKH